MNRFIPIFCLVSVWMFSQNVSQKLDSAIKNLLNTEDAYSASISMYVTDTNGNLIYDFNGKKGLSTASTQKIFTAGCALETLGSNYQYKTTASYNGSIENGTLKGDFILFSNGDPTLGSWRYDGFKPDDFKQKLISSFKKKGITKISGNIILDDSFFDFQTVPGGWPWNDLGNYYGAGVWGINWRENQFDLNVKGDEIQNISLDLPNVKWISELKTGGDSDQSTIFTAPYSGVALINGMLPAGKVTTVSGATPNPPLTLGVEIKKWLVENGIDVQGYIMSTSQQKIVNKKLDEYPKNIIFFEYKSPTLDKIVYWFLKKSVNLYGETLIKTLGKEKANEGSFSAGVTYLKNFWKAKGINPQMINFTDGSGLSPQNYVSAKAQVQALLYAKKQNWYPTFYDGFPIQGNGMQMKGGTMRNTKSFAGYHKGYVFSIIMNNYQGNNSSDALYKVLNVLK